MAWATGLSAAIVRIHPGIVASGAKAPETNMKGIMIIIPANWTTSGRRTRSPMRPNRALIAAASAMSTTTEATASSTLPWNRNPSATAAAMRRAPRASVNSASLMVRAALGRRLDIGKVAKRSWRPLVWSIAAATTGVGAGHHRGDGQHGRGEEVDVADPGREAGAVGDAAEHLAEQHQHGHGHGQ